MTATDADAWSEGLAWLTRESIDLGMYDMPSPCCRAVATDGDVDAAARRILAEEAKPAADRWYNQDPGCSGG